MASRSLSPERRSDAAKSATRHIGKGLHEIFVAWSVALPLRGPGISAQTMKIETKSIETEGCQFRRDAARWAVTCTISQQACISATVTNIYTGKSPRTDSLGRITMRAGASTMQMSTRCKYRSD
jgi:hypothetical protein